MPKYCTYEPKRQRWVYQRRIPERIRKHFDNRTTIREHIGHVSEETAAAYAQRRNTELDRIFASLHDTGDYEHRVEINGTITLERFCLDIDLLPRFLATWRANQFDVFEQELDEIRQHAADGWQILTARIEERRSKAMHHFQTANPEPLGRAISSTEQKLHVRIDLHPGMTTKITNLFNNDQIALWDRCLAVLNGKQSMIELSPQPEDQLPLVEIWGAAAADLAKNWHERRIAVGDQIRPKTHDKYKKIAADLSLVMGRRPVQTIERPNLMALARIWESRGNAPKTVHDKLTILKSLLRSFLAKDTLDSLFRELTGRISSPTAARLPFTAPQLAQYLGLLRSASSVTADDIRCVELMMLTGARLEEIYQLTSADLHRTDFGWLVRIADSRQTGDGQARTKTATSSRLLPVVIPKSSFPELESWLSSAAERNGYLFTKGSTNRFGIRSAAASQRLNRALRKVIPDEQRLVLQSLRNTAGQRLRRSGVDPRVRRRFLGHKDIDLHDKHYDPAELLDEADLLPAAEAIANWIQTECLRDGQPGRKGKSRSFLQDHGDM